MRRKRKDGYNSTPFAPLKKSETQTEALKTIIGSGVQVKGEISGKEDLTVHGQVEGIIDFKKGQVIVSKTTIRACFSSPGGKLPFCFS